MEPSRPLRMYDGSYDLMHTCSITFAVIYDTAYIPHVTCARHNWFRHQLIFFDVEVAETRFATVHCASALLFEDELT